MLRFQNLTKSFWVNGRQKRVIGDVSLDLPARKSVALLGRNGAGKTTLLELISGNMRPDRGEVIADGTVSWPVGLTSAFHPDLSGAENIRFVARIYGVDTQELIAFVADFAELGEFFSMPLRSYSSGMRSRLAFGASMGIRFDHYLVDEVTAVGDSRFRAKSRRIFQERMKDAGAIVVNHNIRQLRAFCDAGMVLEGGQITYFDDLEDAIAYHEANMKQ